MSRNFDLNLTGKAFFPVFYSFFLIIAVYEALLFLTYGATSSGDLRLPVYMAVVFGGVVILVAVAWIYQILFARKVLPALSFDGRAFAFRGKIGEFIGWNLLGILLSAVTLGIYAPWYARRITAYLTERTDLGGKPLEFSSGGGKLFMIMIATLILPMVLVILLLAGYFYLSGTATENPGPVTAALTVVIYVILVPFLYKYYQWYFNGLGWDGRRLKWDTKFWRSVFFIIGQMLLTLVTLGVYWPAALIRLYRYFADRTRVLAGDTVAGTLVFGGRTGEGFLLIWGQFLLSAVTVFVYFPWAFVRVAKWFCKNTGYLSRD